MQYFYMPEAPTKFSLIVHPTILSCFKCKVSLYKLAKHEYTVKCSLQNSTVPYCIPLDETFRKEGLH